MKKLLLAIVLTVVSISATQLMAQTKAELRRMDELRAEAQMSSLLESKNYKFTAVYAVAQVNTSQSMGLTGNYYLSIKDSTLKCVLPFYGNSYSSMMGTVDSPLVFTSKQFKYTATEKQTKKSRRTIIKIEATTEGDRRVFGITLEVIGMGGATLSIESNNTSVMVFTGVIEPLPKQK